MMKRLFVMGVAAGLVASAGAQSTPVATPVAKAAASANHLLVAQSKLRFTAKQMGVPMKGLFTQLGGQVQWRADAPEQSRIRMVVPVASATLGSPEMDAELRKPDWFAADKFPNAVFESTKIERLSADTLRVHGKLSIKGHSQAVQSVAKLSRTGGVTTATGSFDMKRLAFKVGLGAWGDTAIVADEVQVQYSIALQTP